MTHWVECDTYDRRVFATLKSDTPSLRALEESGSRLLPHFDGFLLDVFSLLPVSLSRFRDFFVGEYVLDRRKLAYLPNDTLSFLVQFVDKVVQESRTLCIRRDTRAWHGRGTHCGSHCRK